MDVMTNPDREGKVESSGSDSRASKSGTSSSSSSNERSDSSKSGNSGTNSVSRKQQEKPFKNISFIIIMYFIA